LPTGTGSESLGDESENVISLAEPLADAKSNVALPVKRPRFRGLCE
jgi:hypothetical protein